ncbi:hypothetical protein JZ751_016626, partial [Albula glossodonta]
MRGTDPSPSTLGGHQPLTLHAGGAPTPHPPHWGGTGPSPSMLGGHWALTLHAGGAPGPHPPRWRGTDPLPSTLGGHRALTLHAPCWGGTGPSPSTLGGHRPLTLLTGGAPGPHPPRWGGTDPSPSSLGGHRALTLHAGGAPTPHPPHWGGTGPSPSMLGGHRPLTLHAPCWGGTGPSPSTLGGHRPLTLLTGGAPGPHPPCWGGTGPSPSMLGGHRALTLHTGGAPTPHPPRWGGTGPSPSMLGGHRALTLHAGGAPTPHPPHWGGTRPSPSTLGGHRPLTLLTGGAPGPHPPRWGGTDPSPSSLGGHRALTLHAGGAPTPHPPCSMLGGHRALTLHAGGAPTPHPPHWGGTGPSPSMLGGHRALTLHAGGAPGPHPPHWGGTDPSPSTLGGHRALALHAGGAPGPHPPCWGGTDPSPSTLGGHRALALHTGGAPTPHPPRWGGTGPSPSTLGGHWALTLHTGGALGPHPGRGASPDTAMKAPKFNFDPPSAWLHGIPFHVTDSPPSAWLHGIPFHVTDSPPSAWLHGIPFHVTDSPPSAWLHGIPFHVTDSPPSAWLHERRRQGKFQPFRRLFGKRKKKGPELRFEETQLRSSQSNGDICNGLSSEDEASSQHVRELNSRSLSHDSVFVSEARGDTEQTMSQDNVSDKVRNLQSGSSSDEEDTPTSPLQVEAQVEAQVQAEAALAQVKGAHGGAPTAAGATVRSPRPRRPLAAAGTIESINLDALPQPGPRLDNAAARHKLSVKPKNQRVSRKHRRVTQEIQDVYHPGVLQEEPETPSMPWGCEDQPEDKIPQESKKQKMQEDELGQTELHEHQHREEKRQMEEQERQREKTQIQEEERQREEMRQIEEERQREEAQLKEQERQREEKERLEEVKRQREELRIKEEERHREEERRLEKERQREEERLKAEERQREEERRLEEERQREEERVKEEERQREEKRRLEEERQREEERVKEEERQREEKRRLEEEILREEAQIKEEERKREEEQKREEEKKQREEEEYLHLVEERKRRQEQEERVRQEAERQREEEKQLHEEKERRKKEEEEEERKKLKEAELWEKQQKEKEERQKQMEEAEAGKRVKEKEERRAEDAGVRQRKAAELRWREVEDRQRTFTFKVSSGEKQILFQKVNLTPVTPSGQQGRASEIGDTTAPPTGGADSPALPASFSVPHTAILVTGAQLCGAAVNLNQIKDPACMSLLGLAEDKKAMTAHPVRSSGKTRSLKENPADQASAAVLAEWASIRSKIFRGTEGRTEDGAGGGREREARPTSEDLSQKLVSHGNLRKTLSASAKFSITPARRKFPDTNRPPSPTGNREPPSPSLGSEAQSPTPSKAGKTVRIADGTEGCMFAKDLPSFLVPSPPPGSPKPRALSDSLGASDPEVREGVEGRGPASEDKSSPFGIKLRRTNYSLRFHSEQPTEKRKKRYSAGDSFEGIPTPLTPTEPELDNTVFPGPASPLRESSTRPPLAVSGASTPAMRSESEKLSCRPPLHQKPSVSPKPPSNTPPPSPLSRGTRGEEEEGESPTQQLYEQEEVELKEKRSFFPSINIPWREKGDRRAELRREKPSLQSRHSLDSTRAQEKEAGPLWITLALQKQKGFRDQQQSREERRHMREVKLAEKQAKDRESCALTSPPEAPSGIAAPKAQSSQEGRPETMLAQFERREHLRKSNTLPTSVTVEIADSTTSPPAVKDVAKRFPSSDSQPVSTEPAWLALAKRKAKAWSDCPQIIKEREALSSPSSAPKMYRVPSVDATATRPPLPHSKSSKRKGLENTFAPAPNRHTRDPLHDLTQYTPPSCDPQNTVCTHHVTGVAEAVNAPVHRADAQNSVTAAGGREEWCSARDSLPHHLAALQVDSLQPVRVGPYKRHGPARFCPAQLFAPLRADGMRHLYNLASSPHNYKFHEPPLQTHRGGRVLEFLLG